MIAGRYELLRELGRGGAGTVWLARDSVLGREVAMKRQSGTGERDQRSGEVARREARVAARLHHPHLVTLYDLAEDDGDLWLVMEFVAGPSLTQVVADHGPMTPDEAARIVTGVAEGLRYIHAQGVVHRDVKPSNILLDPSGEPKLADFGIARSAEQTAATITATGAVHGSPAYLAPEIATGRGATDRSDVWSLGATLFHLLTGAPPYADADNNAVAILYRIVHEPVPTTDRAGRLAPLLAGAMTPDPARRWTIEQVADFLAGRPVAGPTGTAELTAVSRAPVRRRARHPRRRPWPWLPYVAAALV
ncbi:MAG: serine/threonine-protein kinase, partial [Nocardioides sp.]|uniref:serine/threonine-protein kinase n=1 Tax=Nocardioides sp. TaxID=35761 RepID=UPI0039E6D3CF